MFKLRSKRDCCGCLACVQVCPKQCLRIAEDSQGFIYPIFDQQSCIDCGLCDKVCPYQNTNINNKPLRVYGAKNRNDNERLKSSSGGIFCLLADKTIESGGVVFGARFDINWNIVHDYSESRHGINQFLGSKYVQSYIGNTFRKVKEFLDDGRKVLFSGTPCQISGLRLFLRKNYNNLITVEIVCHGVPSPKVWRNYLEETKVKLKASTILSINFRHKKYGWHSYNFSLRYINQKGKERVVFMPHSDNLFIKGYLNHLYVRPSCYNCPSKHINSMADITIGDLWGIEQIDSSFDDNKGCSIVCLNTEKGEKMASEILFEYKPIDYELVQRYNPALVKSIDVDSRSESFWSSDKTIHERIEDICGDSLLLKIKKYIYKLIQTPQIFYNE